jgi:hypothetical protein
MKGFTLILTNGNYTDGWNSEGVMFESIKTGARAYPSSFDFMVASDTLHFRITFSSSGLDSGTVYSIPYHLNGKNLELSHNGQHSIYK